MILNINQDRVFSDDGSVDVTVVAGDPKRIKKALELYDTVVSALEIAESPEFVQQYGRALRKPGPVEVREYMKDPLEVKIMRLTEQRNELLSALYCVRGDWRHLKCISKTTSDEVDRVISKVMT